MLVGKAGADTFVRFRVTDPGEAPFAVNLAGNIHKAPWYLPKARFPEGKGEWFGAGEYSPWVHVSEWAGEAMHGRMSRAGGVAEFPFVTVRFEMEAMPEVVGVEIELADRADANAVRKRWREEAPGGMTGFLISPDVVRDAGGAGKRGGDGGAAVEVGERGDGGKACRTGDEESHHPDLAVVGAAAGFEFEGSGDAVVARVQRAREISMRRSGSILNSRNRGIRTTWRSGRGRRGMRWMR